MTDIWIRSASNFFAFLRMDTSRVTSSSGAGSGTVNCQFYAPGSEPVTATGNDEVFLFVPVSDTAFALRSIVSANAYLRIDGASVTEFNAAGSGTVNCQYYPQGTQPQAVPGNDEVFQFVAIPNSPVVAIRSFNYPNAYLRMNAAGVGSRQGNGSGIVNCQYYARGTLPQWAPGNLEVFHVSGIPIKVS
ncbi:hypothetical protein IC762_13170 [Bradyrhizobium genosp. L]|uniref:hypothetical protein n=1 Tax=Bradyrhizobium genosp. L TaxID=83637 RepID=UPI0018A2BD14|nr:hypothetical protein [Bradyrhizobium genosp. L]QPF87176.1 hypothetical protein IC762_13170 [Bradyrhizobium genosp. L]